MTYCTYYFVCCCLSQVFPRRGGSVFFWHSLTCVSQNFDRSKSSTTSRKKSEEYTESGIPSSSTWCKGYHPMANNTNTLCCKCWFRPFGADYENSDELLLDVQEFCRIIVWMFGELVPPSKFRTIHTFLSCYSQITYLPTCVRMEHFWHEHNENIVVGLFY